MSYEQAQKMIEQAERVLVTTHVRPDGDAIGSAAALARLARAAQRRRGATPATQVLMLGAVPKQYGFLLGEGYWLMGREVTAETAAALLDDFDLIVVVDTCAAGQLPHAADYLVSRAGGVLVIDHHLARDALGHCRLVDTDAAAAGEIVFELARRAGWPLDAETAAALFTALATDTGWFRFENTTPRTLRFAGDLVAAGARPDTLYQRLYQSFPAARVRLLAAALGGMTLHCNERLAVMTITRAMLGESGADRGHIENIVNESQQIGSVAATALLVEMEDGQTRVSLRSRGEDIDVNEIARALGGGGHARAAGATIAAPLPTAREKVLELITRALA